MNNRYTAKDFTAEENITALRNICNKLHYIIIDIYTVNGDNHAAYAKVRTQHGAEFTICTDIHPLSFQINAKTQRPAFESFDHLMFPIASKADIYMQVNGIDATAILWATKESVEGQTAKYNLYPVNFKLLGR